MQSTKRLEITREAYLRAAWMQALLDEFPSLSASGLHVSLGQGSDERELMSIPF